MNIPSTSTDLIFHNGTVTTLDRSNPIATAVAIRNGKFLRVGTDADVMPLAGAATRVIDLKGRRVLPGLIDNHLHIIRGKLNFNLELRWDGVRSLADAMEMPKRQEAEASNYKRPKSTYRAISDAGRTTRGPFLRAVWTSTFLQR